MVVIFELVVLFDLDITADFDCAADNTGVLVVVDSALIAFVVVDFLVLASEVVNNTYRVPIQVWKGGGFSSIGLAGHAMRLHSRTGIERQPVSSLNCDRPLYSASKALELVMDAGCVDNR